MTQNTLPGKDTSLWLDTTPETAFEKLEEQGLQVDAVVVGGGITGLLAGWQLQNSGLKVTVIEKERIVQNTTGNTTAKLTSQHYLVYDFLRKEHGDEIAKAYADANQQGIDEIEKLARQLSIDCDFSRRDAYVYTEDDEKVSEIEAEVEAAKSLGLPASFETTTDLPFPVKGAIRFTHQAQFHPRKFLLGVADDFLSRGGRIFEQTAAVDIRPGSPHVVATKAGEIKATYVVEATKYPFWRPEIFEGAMWRKLSYALGVKLRGESPYPRGMYITTDEPLRSIRSHPYENGQLLIFGGESHNQAEDYDKNEHWQELINDVSRKFEVDSVIYRWIAGDTMPNDRLPYIGAYPDHPDIYIATGFRAWGLAWAMAAARIITDGVLSRPNPWQKLFGLERLDS